MECNRITYVGNHIYIRAKMHEHCLVGIFNTLLHIIWIIPVV